MVRSDVFFSVKTKDLTDKYRSLVFLKENQSATPQKIVITFCPVLPRSTNKKSTRRIEKLLGCESQLDSMQQLELGDLKDLSWRWCMGKVQEGERCFFGENMCLLDVRNEQGLPATERDLGGSR